MKSRLPSRFPELRWALSLWSMRFWVGHDSCLPHAACHTRYLPHMLPPVVATSPLSHYFYCGFSLLTATCNAIIYWGRFFLFYVAKFFTFLRSTHILHFMELLEMPLPLSSLHSLLPLACRQLCEVCYWLPNNFLGMWKCKRCAHNQQIKRR